MSARIHQIVSADSHFVEPPDLFTSRVDARYRDRAPRIEVLEASATPWAKLTPGLDGEYWVVPGSDAASPRPVAAFFSAGCSWEEMKAANLRGYAGAPEFVLDPSARLRAQDNDGVAGEVLYSSFGLGLFGIEDDGLRRACFRAFNDWAAEFCSYDPKRLIGCALVDVDDVDAGVTELEHIAKSGLRAGMVTGSPLPDLPYSLDRYDKIWAAAQELDIPLSLHVHTSRKKTKFSHAETTVRAVGEVQESLANMIYGGVFERFPRLKVILCEVDVSWIPHFMYRADHFSQRFWNSSYSMIPSEYMKRNVWATFQDEGPTIPYTADLFGVDRLLWASDFPHMNSTYPDTRDYVAKNFPGMQDEEIEKIVSGNTMELYKIALQMA